MEIGWKDFLPFTIGYLLFIVGTLLALDGLPYVGHGTPLEIITHPWCLARP